MRFAVKQVPPGVAKDVRDIAAGGKDAAHPYYNVEKRKGTGKATCRQCDELIAEGEKTVYFHYAPDNDNEWIRTRGTIHADDCSGDSEQEWTKCPKCREQVPREKWRAHWQKEKGKRVASSAKVHKNPRERAWYASCDSCGWIGDLRGDKNWPKQEADEHECYIRCPNCDGSGCDYCQSTGIANPGERMAKSSTTYERCLDCDGSGIDRGMEGFYTGTEGKSCATCNGSGIFDKSPNTLENIGPRVRKEIVRRQRKGHCGQCDEDHDDDRIHHFKINEEAKEKEAAMAIDITPLLRDHLMSKHDDEQPEDSSYDAMTIVHRKKHERDEAEVKTGQATLRRKNPTQGLDPGVGGGNETTMGPDTDAPPTDENPSNPPGWHPRVDPATQNKGKEMMSDNLDTEVGKLQRGLKRLPMSRVAARDRQWWNTSPDKYEPCGRCDGTGSSQFSGEGACSRCNGSGLTQTYNPGPPIGSASGARRWAGWDDEAHWRNSWRRGDHFDVRDQFEDGLSRYTGSKYLVGIGSNTGVWEDQTHFHVRHHDTDILSLHKTKPEVTVTGWDSMTTKQRTNGFLPKGFSVGNSEVRPGKHNWERTNYVLETPAGAYALGHTRQVTVNTQTGLATSGAAPDYQRCEHCHRFREPDEMERHVSRHETYRKNYEKQPYSQCGDCNGTGGTEPWQTGCKTCKGLGMTDLPTGSICDDCRGSGITWHRGARTKSHYNYETRETERTEGVCGRCDGEGKIKKREPV